MEKKYGLFTAISMVVGIVIGSGVFFKSEAVLRACGGDMKIGIIAWAAVGFIMLVCARTFAIFARKHKNAVGIVGYAESAIGRGYGFYVGWFMIMIYYPTLASTLAWLSARYTGAVFGFDSGSAECMSLAFFFLCLSYAINALFPRLAGRLQVTTTAAKLLPLILMAVFGVAFGIASGRLADNFGTYLPAEVISERISGYMPSSAPLSAAVVSAAFAYEGWIIALSINSELHNAEKNLPRALIAGSVLVAVVYILYYIGIAGGADKLSLMADGERGVAEAYKTVFGSFGTALMLFIVISCLGTLNGLMFACTRGMYELSSHARGFDIFSEVSDKNDMPQSSAVFGLFISAAWLLYYFNARISPTGALRRFGFDSSELPIISLYAMYIPIFFKLIREKKYIMLPSLAIGGCLFMIYAAAISHRRELVYYLILFAVVMLLGTAARKSEQKFVKNDEKMFGKNS